MSRWTFLLAWSTNPIFSVWGIVWGGTLHAYMSSQRFSRLLQTRAYNEQETFFLSSVLRCIFITTWELANKPRNGSGLEKGEQISGQSASPNSQIVTGVHQFSMKIEVWSFIACSTVVRYLQTRCGLRTERLSFSRRRRVRVFRTSRGQRESVSYLNGICFGGVI